MIRNLGLGKIHRLEEIVNTVNPNQVKEIIVKEARSNSCSLMPDVLEVEIGYMTYRIFIADLDERCHKDNYDRIMRILYNSENIPVKKAEKWEMLWIY